MIIEDGAGTGYKAQVDAENRISTNATTNTELHYASLEKGLAYDFSTGGFISITSVDTETGVFYLKNSSTSLNLVINSIRTCANAVQKVQIYKNPTGGTLITNETTGTSTNLNFNSSNTASVIVYKGAEGSTISGGSLMTNHINGVGHSTAVFENALIIGPGSSIGITFELATAGDCCVRVVSYYE